MYTVYVLFSEKSRKIYIRFTSAFEIRLLSHNYLATKGFTKRYRPWTVALEENYTDKTQAIIREKQLKSGQGRAWIWKLISEKFPSALDSYPP